MICLGTADKGFSCAVAQATQAEQAGLLGQAVPSGASSVNTAGGGSPHTNIRRSESHKSIQLLFATTHKQYPPYPTPPMPPRLVVPSPSPVLGKYRSSKNVMDTLKFATQDCSPPCRSGSSGPVRKDSNSPIRTPKTVTHQKTESVTAAMQEKYNREAFVEKNSKNAAREPEVASRAEKRRVWKGENGVFRRKLLADWYKHMCKK